MSVSSDSAEMVVRFAFEGAEVALKLAGAGAKELALMLASALKEHKSQKSAGKEKLKKMLKDERDLKVFSLPRRDLKAFVNGARKYGVLYSAIRDRAAPDGMMDIIVKSSDADRLKRVIERYNLASVEKASVHSEEVELSKEEKLINDALKEPEVKDQNPTTARKEPGLPSEPCLKDTQSANTQSLESKDGKPSVRAKLEKFKNEQLKKIKPDRSRSRNAGTKENSRTGPGGRTKNKDKKERTR